METKFNFKSQICTTREQSEKLITLGLKKETADCHYPTSMLDGQPCGCIIVGNPSEQNNYHAFPAWSLHRLLCLYGADYTIKEVYNNAEECYGMLISAIGIAIEDGYFNKEYLEETL